VIFDLAAEWLEADDLGGFASGTVGLVRTRRYHALLLTATTPPTGRVVLVNGVEAWVNGKAVSSQCYAPDMMYPDGATRITDFANDPWPAWVFTLPDGTIILHEICVSPACGETILRWRRQSGTEPCRVTVRLLLSGRNYHALHKENPDFCFDAQTMGGNVSWRPYAHLPAIAALTNGVYTHAPEWYRNFLYTAERDRGLDATEDLASPGIFTFDLMEGDAAVVLRAGDGLSVNAARHAAELVAGEDRRRTSKPSRLTKSTESYGVMRSTGRTLLAGFPWFTDWGRDTFIAMRGLVLGTGDLATASQILLAWADTVSEGMLPNRFPDSGGPPEYNAVDASLWYIVTVHDFITACTAKGQSCPPALQETCEAILRGYAAGTRYGIGADEDGLLKAGVPGVQLTWMDAKTDEHVVTPRIGKPVEIQALWINALLIAGLHWSQTWTAMATRAQAAFTARFPNAAGGLFDVVDANGTPGKTDNSVRPNQIFAVGGLPFPLLTGPAARDVVNIVQAKLLTPLGLRTLAPDDAAYIGQYLGGPAQRDGAYHQGTAWPWLMGAFVDAWLAVRGRSGTAKAEAETLFLAPLMAHLDQAGLGHVSEIVDGDAPHTPGGCPFQAWSLGELIRIRHMLDLPA
jgi:predicted glycogen debranching enzyme